MLSRSLNPAEPGHPFGFDRQGCDIYSRTIYGARASVTVGVLTTLIVTLLGTLIGAIAGFYGGIWDTLLSRLTDIFFAVPLVLAAIVVIVGAPLRRRGALEAEESACLLYTSDAADEQCMV